MDTRHEKSRLERLVEAHGLALMNRDEPLARALARQIAEEESRHRLTRAPKGWSAAQAGEAEPASERQVASLRALGVQVPPHVGRHEASAMIEAMLDRIE